MSDTVTQIATYVSPFQAQGEFHWQLIFSVQWCRHLSVFYSIALIMVVLILETKPQLLSRLQHVLSCWSVLRLGTERLGMCKGPRSFSAPKMFQIHC
jgi:hypothetical protein